MPGTLSTAEAQLLFDQADPVGDAERDDLVIEVELRRVQCREAPVPLLAIADPHERTGPLHPRHEHAQRSRDDADGPALQPEDAGAVPARRGKEAGYNEVAVTLAV